MRPCADDHPDPRPDSPCRLCQLYATDPKYRAYWDGVPVAAVRIRLPCVREGAVLESCKTCGGESKHVRDCDLHERCTRVSLGGPIRGCDACPDYRPPSALHLSAARGIGDAVSGLYAACGLASALQEPVTYHCHHPAWLSGVSHPWLTIATHVPVGADVFDDYDGELRAANAGTCPSRVQWYCDRAAASLRVPAFSGRRPSTVVRPEPVVEPGYVLLAPFSAHNLRQWPAQNWTRLARDLSDAGRRVVATSGPGDGGRMVQMFSRIPGVECHAGKPVPWVISLVANAGRVYGNDSGLVHLAGLHGVPAVAVMTHLKASFVFGDTAPSVQGVGADRSQWPCQGCAWRGDNYRPVCRKACGALISISADRVRSAKMGTRHV